MRRTRETLATCMLLFGLLSPMGCEEQHGPATGDDDPFAKAFGSAPATPAADPAPANPAPAGTSVPIDAAPAADAAPGSAPPLIRTVDAAVGEAPGDSVQPVVHEARARANLLAQTNSPYLLQHAHNPVDWHPWGPEALEKARRENKPIFLSIGYSSCHWCHVMERLVFSDVDIASQMNRHFVCIKVDQEERPDVDQVYMTGLLVYQQALGGEQAGGWPLSLFLTPEGKPFLGGTYFPPAEQDGRPGFPQVCERAHTLWTEKPDTVREFADVITTQMRRTLSPSLVLPAVELDRELANGPAKALLASFDEQHGGFGFDADQPEGPKFPVGSRLALLQYHVRRFGDAQAEQAVRVTLDAMANGGLRDHLAGGFHRYSTDREWHVPHFEKMLYDQAQLASVYTEAYRHGHQRVDREIAESTLDFVLAELRAPGGAFFSSLDAETDGVEGAYYVWTAEQVRNVLGAEDAALFEAAYGFEDAGTFEHGVVLRRTAPLADLVRQSGLEAQAVEARLAELRAKLLAARSQRERPRLDDKILVAWNGLAIRALADAGRILGRDDYTAAADRVAMFLLTHLRDDEGRLLRSYREGEAGIAACLDDYAFLVDGLLALHDATDDEKWSNAARRLVDQQIERFGEESGGFLYTARDGETLVVPLVQGFDSALPSGNAVSARNLLRIGSISGVDRYTKLAHATIRTFAGDMQRGPTGTSTMALALAELLDDPNAAVILEKAPATPLAEAPERRVAAKDPDAVLDGPLEPEGDAPAPSTAPDQPVIQLAGNEEPTGDDEEKKDEILEARAFLEFDRLPAGGKCRVLFLLVVREGWHVNANQPGPDYKVPTEVTLVTKSGTRLAGVVYPKGEPVRDEELEETTYEYAKEVAVQGVLEIPAEAAGKTEELEVRVRYQACKDGRCLRPTTMTLKGSVAVAAAGDPLKSVNAKYFDGTERR